MLQWRQWGLAYTETSFQWPLLEKATAVGERKVAKPWTSPSPKRPTMLHASGIMHGSAGFTWQMMGLLVLTSSPGQGIGVVGRRGSDGETCRAYVHCIRAHGSMTYLSIYANAIKITAKGQEECN